MVIPLITSLISNPNTPFEQNRLLPCGLFCFKRIVMKHIKDIIEINIEESRSLDLYLPNDNYAVLDIETTGLSPAYHPVILAGLLVVKNGTAQLNQYFATTPDDELELLSRVRDMLSSVKYLITYNGRLFDIPFLNKRFQKHGLIMPDLFNLDLFVLIKHYSDIPKFISKLNQKTIEEYAGIHNLREDRISGGESVDLYNHYLETGALDLERRILLHNADDLKQLLRLRTLLKNTDIHRAFYKTGFPVNNGRITGIALKKSDLIIKGLSYHPEEYIAFPSLERPFHMQMSAKSGEFQIELPCEKKEDNVYVDISFLNNEAKELLSIFPTYINHYLILVENGTLHYPSVNMLAMLVAELSLDTSK